MLSMWALVQDELTIATSAQRPAAPARACNATHRPWREHSPAARRRGARGNQVGAGMLLMLLPQASRTVEGGEGPVVEHFEPREQRRSGDGGAVVERHLAPADPPEHVRGDHGVVDVRHDLAAGEAGQGVAKGVALRVAETVRQSRPGAPARSAAAGWRGAHRRVDERLRREAEETLGRENDRPKRLAEQSQDGIPATFGTVAKPVSGTCVSGRRKMIR